MCFSSTQSKKHDYKFFAAYARGPIRLSGSWFSEGLAVMPEQIGFVGAA